MKIVIMMALLALTACQTTPQFNDAVYQEPEFLADCIEYMMKDCF